MKKKVKKKGVLESHKNIVNFLFEVGMLNKTPRSGFHFLGTGRQSVAEHVHRTIFIAYTLAMMCENVDVLKVMKMSLFHDITESRISDLNHIHQKYVERREQSAVEDLVNSVPFGDDMYQTLHEYKERKTKEAILVKDADNLEWIFSLKEEVDTGNTRAFEWMSRAIHRLKTDEAKSLAYTLTHTDSNDWWFPKDSVINKRKYI